MQRDGGIANVAQKQIIDSCLCIHRVLCISAEPHKEWSISPNAVRNLVARSLTFAYAWSVAHIWMWVSVDDWGVRFLSVLSILFGRITLCLSFPHTFHFIYHLQCDCVYRLWKYAKNVCHTIVPKPESRQQSGWFFNYCLLSLSLMASDVPAPMPMHWMGFLGTVAFCEFVFYLATFFSLFRILTKLKEPKITFGHINRISCIHNKWNDF